MGPRISPPPIQCTDWTAARIIEYSDLVESGQYPALAQQIVEWNEACVGNRSLIGGKDAWDAPERPWWRFW